MTDEMATPDRPPPLPGLKVYADTPLCVAICTHDRPRQLADLLDGLLDQEAAGDFAVAVIDNGSEPVQDLVDRYRVQLPIVYEHIPEAGLAAVRNRALHQGMRLGCTFLAFIDDDEVPEPLWLARLMQAQVRTRADLVFGPVLASYHGTPPAWVVDGGFFERWGTTPGCGNVLIRMAILPGDPAKWFLDIFGSLGGEDAEFFDRLGQLGAVSAVAADALAYEDTPPARTTVRYIWRRGLRDGAVIAQRIALGNRPRHRKLLFGARRLVEKLGHAVNHLFWSPKARWRAVRAVADFGSAWAILLFALGYRFHFYGRRQRRRAWRVGRDI